MISYIASILGLQGQYNSTNTAPVGGPRDTPDSDYVSYFDNRDVRIFGHPPQEEIPESIWRSPFATGGEFGRDGPYIQSLITGSPAMIKYIMGDDWHSQLGRDRSNMILRPSSTSNVTTDHSQTAPDNGLHLEAEERAHSLRMRRCGAEAISAKTDSDNWYEGPTNKFPDHFFGWPKGGGVWIVRPSWSRPLQAAPDGFQSDEELMEEKWKEAERYQVDEDLALEVLRQVDMEDVCRVLEGAGAQFYAKIEDCPEAVERNLC